MSFKKLFAWTLPPQGNIEDADAIIVHAAGASLLPDGGKVNNMLADVIVDILKIKRLPIIAQAEVAEILEARCIPIFSKSETQSERREYGLSYLSTRNIALWHERLCRAYDFKKVVLVSHQGHLPRAYWTTKKQCSFFLEIIVPKIPSGIYDNRNSQVRWRYAYTALPYETLMRTIFLLSKKM